MTLAELNKNEYAKVLNIAGDEDLINRLASFGVLEECEIKVIEFSIAKNTMEIDCEGTALALRIKEANLIQVEKI